MIITEQQFFEYMFCPTRYDLKYNLNINIPEQVTLSKLVDKVAKYYCFYMLCNQKLPKIEELKRKWDSICKENQDFINIKNNLEGWGLIVNFENWAYRNKIIVADTQSKYNIVLGDHVLTGQMETILKRPDGKKELLVSHFSNKVPDQTEIDMKTKYTLNCLAFKSTYDEYLSGIHVKLLKNGGDMYTYRTALDYKRLEVAIENVAAGIEQQIFYPREGVLCSTCNARQFCKTWYKQGR